MKSLVSLIIATSLFAGSVPALAASGNDAGGNGPVAGEGPGGSGAGQTSGGPQRPKMKHHRAHRAKTM